MNANIVKFLRNTPPKSLKHYIGSYPPPLSTAVNWTAPPKNVANPLLKAVDDLSDTDLARLNSNAERINEMTDEIGQTALMSMLPDEHLEAYQALQNEHDRALYVFTHDQDAFHRAEEIRYTDYYRKGRSWNGFKGPTNTKVSNEPLDIEAFKAKIRDHFRISGNIKVEIFSRNKNYADQDLNIIQIMVYREGLPESYTALENDDLVAKTFRPAIEMALTYEPVSGQIEVIAKSKEEREELAKSFAATLLQTEIDGQKITLKEYDIAKLLHSFDFPTDPDDGIERVDVMMLKLKPYDSNNKVTLEITAKEKRSIYDISDEWFKTNDPLKFGFLLSQVKLVIRFAPDEHNHRGKVVPVKITYPNGCDLSDKTEKERLIGKKYLKRWGILREL